MRELDGYAIRSLGMPGAMLMENAGAAVAREACLLCRRLGLGAVHVVCGTGNNGGDGFVAARHLAAAGYRVTYEIAGDPIRVSGDAATHLGLLRAMGAEIAPPSSPGSLYVDALLGTGSRGAPRGHVAEAIERINGARGPVLSVDIPSGVDTDTGAVPGPAIQALATVTFGFLKPGLVIYPGAARAGRVVVDPIGLDWARLPFARSLSLYGRDDAAGALPRREPDAHKGAFGHVLVIGGSEGMAGAPTLTARAALRSGAGLVTLAVPRSALRATIACPEAMCAILPERDGAVTAEAADALEAALHRATVVCIGPGLTTQTGVQEFVRSLVRRCPHPIVADADALNALAGHDALCRERAAPMVLTPHPGECARLLDTTVSDVQADRLAAAREVSDQYGAAVVLKGAGTIIADPPQPTAPHSTLDRRQTESDGDGSSGTMGRASVLSVGNPGMATGGSGDVLTGIVGALIGQGLPLGDAARLAAFCHGRAGDLAMSEHTEHGLVAGDIIEMLPAVLKELTQ